MFPKSFQKLIEHFSSLPSVGPKMAERLVLHLFKQKKDNLNVFVKDLQDFANNVNFCPCCYNLSEGQGECSICQDKKRKSTMICVVEDPLDVIAIEKTRRYSGKYHVLGGNLSVMSQEEIGKLKINELFKRVEEGGVREVIVATNPTTDGDTTALYLARKLKTLGVRVTRLARGIPTGGDIEYADEITLSSAIEGRREV
jgi:recombination protein RecR